MFAVLDKNGFYICSVKCQNMSWERQGRSAWRAARRGRIVADRSRERYTCTTTPSSRCIVAAKNSSPRDNSTFTLFCLQCNMLAISILFLLPDDTKRNSQRLHLVVWMPLCKRHNSNVLCWNFIDMQIYKQWVLVIPHQSKCRLHIKRELT